jgi:hypothetical protein
MNNARIPPQIEMPAELALALFEAAAASARAAAGRLQRPTVRTTPKRRCGRVRHAIVE